MAPFESKELMFSLALDESDLEQKHAVLQIEGCPSPTVKVVFASCGPTQRCQVKPASFKLNGVEGLKSLKDALSEMLTKLGPVEAELRAQEAAKPPSKPTKRPAKKS